MISKNVVAGRSARPELTKEFLTEQYSVLRKSSRHIARETGWSDRTVCHKCQRNGVELRQPNGGVATLLFRRFGRGEVLAHLGSRPQSPNSETTCVWWKLLCDCGQEYEAHTSSLISLMVKSCGCLQKEAAATTGRNNALPNRQAAMNRILREYQRKAKNRRLDFLLAREELIGFVTGPCHYCGISPRERRVGRVTIPANGIDRVDNDIGYVPGNVVSCCTDCNYMKRKMTADAFLAHAARIVEHQGQRVA